MDAPADSAAYERGTSNKLEALCHAAALSKADALILPDIGCGVFQNDPKVVGRLAGQALKKYRNIFRKVVITGKQEFFDAIMAEMVMTSTPSGRLLRMMTTSKVSKDAALRTDCPICGKPLKDTPELSLLLTANGRRAEGMLFLRTACKDRLAESFPDHAAMTLPQAAEDPGSFLRALDVDGNNVLTKDEVRAAAAVVWSGSEAELDRELDAVWKQWDMDGDGSLSLGEVTQLPAALTTWLQRCAPPFLAKPSTAKPSTDNWSIDI